MKILKWFVDSHIWIGLGSVALAIFTLRIIEAEIDPVLLSFLFTSTFFIYNFQSFIKWKSRKTSSANRSLVRLKELKWMTALSFLALIPIVYSMDLGKISFLGIFGFISFFYAAKMRWSLKKRTDLRSIPYLKIYLIAIVWVGVSSAFPIYYANHSFGSNELLLLFLLFFYFIGITIPFDIRDMKYDPFKMKTIPQILGLRSSKILAVFLLILSSVIAILLYLKAFFGIEIMLLSLTIFFVSTILSYNCDNEKFNHYYSGLIDGTIVLFGLAYFF